MHSDLSHLEPPCLTNHWRWVISKPRETVLSAQPCLGAVETVAATWHLGPSSFFLTSVLSDPLCCFGSLSVLSVFLFNQRLGLHTFSLLVSLGPAV